MALYQMTASNSERQTSQRRVAKIETIFVSIASYRDKMCVKTIEDIFDKAAVPSRIFLGICEQNKELGEACVNPNTAYAKNIRKVSINYTEAKGPTWARFICSTLYNNEDYFFQIDSHTKLVKDWDIKCIDAIHALQNQGVLKPILSHYPLDIADYANYTPTLVPRITKSFFNDRGMISFEGAELIETNGQLIRNAYIAAGCIFTIGQFVKEVPFDPTLDYVFVGEEILLSARAYTSGYDVFTPSENIAFHFYTRSDSPKIWTDNPYYSDLEAFDRIKCSLKLKNYRCVYIDEKYGLGNVRTLESFYDFTGIDTKSQTTHKSFGPIQPNIGLFTILFNTFKAIFRNVLSELSLETIIFGMCFLIVLMSGLSFAMIRYIKIH
jgi:hypothetical protein